MLRNSMIFRNILFIGSIVLLFIVSYLRYSYYINPNLSGEPAFIKIAGSKASNPQLLDLNENNILDINNQIKGRSIIVFWFLFGMTNCFLFYIWRQNEKDLVFFLITWTGLTIVVMIFAGLHYLFRPEPVFFGLFAKIKNFLLSPLYTGVIFIFARFFNRIVQKE